MKKLVFKIILFFSPIWVRLLKYIADTGQGTDICLNNGFLPMRVHFYSPIPDLADLEQRKIWDKKSDLAGIDFRPDQQVRLLGELGAKFGSECNWPPDPTGNPLGVRPSYIPSFGITGPAGSSKLVPAIHPRSFPMLLRVRRQSTSLLILIHLL
jgi:hypothetical protein